MRVKICGNHLDLRDQILHYAVGRLTCQRLIPCYCHPTIRPRRWWKEKPLKFLHLRSNFHTTQGSANGSLKQILITKQIEPLRYRHLNFDALIRHQIQALSFASFCQEKEESPSAASGGKPSVAEKVYGKWWHKPVDECYKKMSFTLRFKRILSCPGRTGLFSFDSKRNKTAGSQFFYPSQ